MIRSVILAIGRFFGFFFALVLTLAVIIACYALVAAQSFSNTWDAVKALVLAAVVLLILTIGTAALDDYLEKQVQARAGVAPLPVESAS